jgi:hypothetical protein
MSYAEELYGTGDCARCGGMPRLRPLCPDCKGKKIKMPPDPLAKWIYNTVKVQDPPYVPLCPECEQPNPIAPDDYLCQNCRAIGVLYKGLSA